MAEIYQSFYKNVIRPAQERLKERGAACMSQGPVPMPPDDLPVKQRLLYFLYPDSFNAKQSAMDQLTAQRNNLVQKMFDMVRKASGE